MTRGRDPRISVAGGFLAGLLLVAGVVPSTVSAQDMDARWLPWLGCWEGTDAGEDAPLLCIRPAAQGEGVEFVTWAEGELSASEAILADGVPRSAEREECRGTEEARFSDDGNRVYLKSDYVCDGGIQRSASGILAMVNPMEWIDIKAVDGTPWVLRYRLARASRVEEAGMENVVASKASAVKAARIAASARLTEEDLVEVAGKVDAAAVEALIVERGDPYPVNAAMLIRLDDAGVPGSVIDLAVAVSFPDRFAVKAGPVPVEEYETDVGLEPRRRMYMGTGFYDPWYRGFGYSPYYGYGYGSLYGYSMYGYGGYGYGGYGYPYYSPVPVVVQPRTSGGSMVRGQGYTRGSGSGYTGGQAQPRGGSAGASGGSRATSSPAVRSGGGSSSTGRTAKPRGGGGGEAVSSSSRSAPSRTPMVRTSTPTVRTSTPTVRTGTSTVRTAKPRTGGGGGSI